MSGRAATVYLRPPDPTQCLPGQVHRIRRRQIHRRRHDVVGMSDAPEWRLRLNQCLRVGSDEASVRAARASGGDGRFPDQPSWSRVGTGGETGAIRRPGLRRGARSEPFRSRWLRASGPERCLGERDGLDGVMGQQSTHWQGGSRVPRSRHGVTHEGSQVLTALPRTSR
jgi:hypothetical protein